MDLKNAWFERPEHPVVNALLGSKGLMMESRNKQMEVDMK